MHTSVSAIEDGADNGVGCDDSKIGLRNISDNDSIMQVGRRKVAIIFRGILPFGTGPGQRCGFSRDGHGYARMERAILLIPCHLAVCIARERDRLTVHGGKPIDPRGAQWILGFIHSSKEAVAVHHFKRMAGSIGVRAYIVCRPRSSGLLRSEPACKRDDNSRKHRKTQRMPVCAI